MGCLSCLNRIFLKKTFSLNHELDVKTNATEGRSKPKHRCWLNYIGIVLLIGFALFLVLSNVDFSDEAEAKTTQERTSQQITTTTETKQAKYAVAQEKKTSLICNEKKSCETVVCTGGPIHSLAYYLESFDRDCGNVYFDVIIENCTFHEKTIAQFTISGLYNMNSLTIRNCELEKVADTAFNQVTVKKLTNLTFEAVQLNTLNAKTFMGLQALEHFKLINKQQTACTAPNFKSFLQPMVNTLSTLVVQQTQMNCNVAISNKPSDWFGGQQRYDKLLSVDLSGTNLNNTLNHQTFLNLSAVRVLTLANCSITVIAGNTFDSVLTTLIELDLRDNNLRTLDAEFLSLATLAYIKIDMAGNQWSCACNNEAVVDFVKHLGKSHSSGVKCASPVEVRGVEIRDVQLQCDREVISSITNTTQRVSTWSESAALGISESDGNPLQPRTTQGVPAFPVKPIPPQTTTKLPPDYHGCDVPLPGILNCNNMSASCVSGNFSVEVLSPTSIRVHIGSYDKSLNVMYFEAFSYSATTLPDIDKRTPASFDVHNLKSNKSYTFCLIQYQGWKTSPFDCRSVYLPMEASPTWLNNDDKSFFYAIVICSIVVCCIIGVVVIYGLLRWRTKLMQKSAHSEMASMFSADEGSKNCADIKFYDNIQYLRTSNLHKQRIVTHNRPPIESAPAAPHPYIDVLRNEELQTEGICEKGRMLFLENKHGATNSSQHVLENAYESLNYYQELY